jgi:hypothetical protein
MAADPTAAAARAAYDVLVSQYPDQQKRLDYELALWMTEIPFSVPKQSGIALGKATAAAVLARRLNDGWDTKDMYTFASGPGQYKTTPPWDGFVLQPGFRAAMPFALTSGQQFRPPPPPAVTSPAYAEAFREVKSYGHANSRLRSEDQTAFAVWWMEFSEGSVNRVARHLVMDRGIDLWTATRMFAHINMALFDVYIAVWHSKYEYNHWRPYTAVRAAADDGNPDTLSESDWDPLRLTAPFPEYVSAHAAGCAASFAILAHVFGDQLSFTMTTTTAPATMSTRSFSSFSQAAKECADSRVLLGWHFRYSVIEGSKLGSSVAAYVIERQLRPAR